MFKCWNKTLNTQNSPWPWKTDHRFQITWPIWGRLEFCLHYLKLHLQLCAPRLWHCSSWAWRFHQWHRKSRGSMPWWRKPGETCQKRWSFLIFMGGGGIINCGCTCRDVAFLFRYHFTLTCIKIGSHVFLYIYIYVDWSITCSQVPESGGYSKEQGSWQEEIG